jgi:hypothetical protein
MSKPPKLAGGSRVIKGGGIRVGYKFSRQERLSSVGYSPGLVPAQRS